MKTDMYSNTVPVSVIAAIRIHTDITSKDPVNSSYSQLVTRIFLWWVDTAFWSPCDELTLYALLCGVIIHEIVLTHCWFPNDVYCIPNDAHWFFSRLRRYINYLLAYLFDCMRCCDLWVTNWLVALYIGIGWEWHLADFKTISNDTIG